VSAVTLIEVEVTRPPEHETPRQRTTHYFAMIFGVVALLIGLNLRNSALNATSLYINNQAGIRAYYPANWLLDTQGNYIFRVRDLAQSGFKTTIQIAALPISSSTSDRNVVDALTLRRSQTLSTYTVFAIEPFLLPDDVAATAVTYTFVSAETNPFLESVPVVVEGLDILTIKRGQAIIITFQSDSRTYQQNYPLFEQFVRTLEF
jgi:hypothetical protein